MIDPKILKAIEEQGADPFSVRMLIEHGQRKGYLTHKDIIHCVPESEFDDDLMSVILATLVDAGIPYREEGDEEDESEAALEGEEELDESSLIDPETMIADLSSVETDDITDLYFKEATRTPLLTGEQEVELAERIEAGRQASERLRHAGHNPGKRLELHASVEDGRQARDHLIRANARLVISIAKRYMNRGLPFLDLIQEGNIGLMRAIRNFDYQRGYKFSTYATYWIRQAVTRALAEQSRTIRLPVYMSDQVDRLRRTQARLQQELGRSPTKEELAQALDLTAERVEEMMTYLRQPVSLHRPVGEDDEEELGDFIEDEAAANPEEAVAQVLVNEDLQQRLATLPERERRLLEMRFGLTDEEPQSLSEVGRRMGITRERARQLEAQALKRLRSLPRDGGDGGSP